MKTLELGLWSSNSMPKHPFHDICVGPGGLYAASGELVQLFDSKTGELKKTFQAYAGPNPPVPENEMETEPARNDDSEPSKKKPKASKPRSEMRNHIHDLKPVKSGKYVVATGSEDKSLLVFDSDLNLVSKQWFPKRPSSIDTFETQDTVLVGDKFGDVYAQDIEDAEIPLPESREPILGHVSLLVDVVAAELEDGQKFVITADRDEHIRVTQYPKSWIIDRWLYGHYEFVSCILQLQDRRNLLVSGGGDKFICLWDWTLGKLLQVETLTIDDSEVSVKKMLLVPSSDLLVLFTEGSSQVLYYRVGDNVLEHAGSITVPYPVASIAVDSDTLFVSYVTDGDVLIGAFSHSTRKAILSNACTAISSLGSTDVSVGNKVALDTISQLRKRAQH
jgi:tRNA (guanine-N(7)-)-methyltransferase subunit TRM82